MSILGGITDNLINSAGSLLGNMANKVIDMAPGLITTAIAAYANTVFPGSGPIVQAIAAPLVSSAVDVFAQAVDDVLLPAASDALQEMDFGGIDGADFAASLASNFIDGLAAGFNG